MIPHGVIKQQDTGLRPGDHALADLSPDRQYVLIFGNLRGYKGIPTLLKAWQSVISKIRNTDLIIAGRFISVNGPIDCAQSITGLSIANAIMTGKKCE